MTATTKPAPHRRRNQIIIGCLIVGFVGFIWITLDQFTGIRETAAGQYDLNMLNQCYLGTRIYEADYGALPKSLEEIYPEIIEETLKFYSKNWKTGELTSFLYQTDDLDSTPLLMSPNRFNRRHNVIFYGKDPEKIKKAEFNRYLSSGNWTSVPANFQ